MAWTARCYRDDQGRDVIDAWYQQQPEPLQAKFDARIRHLLQQPRDKWTRPHFDGLRGNCRGLGEIRFEFKNVQYRPLGFFSDQDFVLLLVATKKGGTFDPRNACELGLRRMQLVEQDKRRWTRECIFE